MHILQFGRIELGVQAMCDANGGYALAIIAGIVSGAVEQLNQIIHAVTANVGDDFFFAFKMVVDGAFRVVNFGSNPFHGQIGEACLLQNDFSMSRISCSRPCNSRCFRAMLFTR
ncbi:MAG: hypothetical protein OQL06_09175 [Gammaproteobacteria bacterium]|nr:hypothetical protein [Gammaproteobacteria bacterium]